MIRLLELPARVANAVADVTIGTAIVLVQVARANRERDELDGRTRESRSRHVAFARSAHDRAGPAQGLT